MVIINNSEKFGHYSGAVLSVTDYENFFFDIYRSIGEAYSEPCQTSNMEFFAKTVPLTILANSSI